MFQSIYFGFRLKAKIAKIPGGAADADEDDTPVYNHGYAKPERTDTVGSAEMTKAKPLLPPGQYSLLKKHQQYENIEMANK